MRVRLRPAWSPADAILGFEKPTVIPCGHPFHLYAYLHGRITRRVAFLESFDA